MTEAKWDIKPQAFRQLVRGIEWQLLRRSTQSILLHYDAGYAAEDPSIEIDMLDKISDSHCRLAMQASRRGETQRAARHCAGENLALVAIRALTYKCDGEEWLRNAAVSIVGDIWVILCPLYPPTTRRHTVILDELLMSCFGMTEPQVEILDWMVDDTISAGNS